MEQEIDMNKLRWEIPSQRMYSVVLYNLSPIQKGIQSQHAITDYSLIHGNESEYQRWAYIDKTTIILDGGGSDTFLEHMSNLTKLGVKLIPFNEPDLYSNITAFCFLLDEKVWDRKKYPDIITTIFEKDTYKGVDFGGIKYDTTPAPLIKTIGENSYYLRKYIDRLYLAK